MAQQTALVAAVRDVLQSGVSQRKLAKQAGVSHATVSKLMSGEAKGVGRHSSDCQNCVHANQGACCGGVR